jgi:hypothetical protein
MDQNGLRQFKAGWGTEEKVIRYYKYDYKKSNFVVSNNKVTGLHNTVFRNMPIYLSKLIGRILYKHAG